MRSSKDILHVMTCCFCGGTWTGASDWHLTPIVPEYTRVVIVHRCDIAHLMNRGGNGPNHLEILMLEKGTSRPN